MAWISLTEDDLKGEFAAGHWSAIQRNLADGDAAPDLAEWLADAAAEVRDAIASNPANKLDATAGTIPRGFRPVAVAIAAFRFAAIIELTEEEFKAKKQLAADARKKLEAVAAGKVRVEPPGGWESGGSGAEDAGKYGATIIPRKQRSQSGFYRGGVSQT